MKFKPGIYTKSQLKDIVMAVLYSDEYSDHACLFVDWINIVGERPRELGAYQCLMIPKKDYHLWRKYDIDTRRIVR